MVVRRLGRVIRDRGSQAARSLGHKADIHSLRADIQVMRSEWKADPGEVKADLHAHEARQITWIGGLVVAGAAAAAIAVNQAFGPPVGG